MVTFPEESHALTKHKKRWNSGTMPGELKEEAIICIRKPEANGNVKITEDFL
jgi:hypothetical protein